MNIKISTMVDRAVWTNFKHLSSETHQSISGLLSEALGEFIQRKRVRPEFLKQMDRSIQENQALGKLLAQ